MEFDVPETLKDMHFSKTYFDNGLIIIRDIPISLNDRAKKLFAHKMQKQPNQKTQKSSNHNTKVINMRPSVQDMSIKSAANKLSTRKCHDVGKEDMMEFQD